MKALAYAASMSLLAALQLAAPPAQAQWQTYDWPLLSDARVPSPLSRTISEEPVWYSDGRLVLGGVVGGGLGVAGGALVGAAISRDCDRDYCELGGAVLGAMAGELIMLPLGVHVANGRQGNYLWDIIGSVGGAAVGLAIGSIAVAAETEPLVQVAFWATPVLQMLGAIRVERLTSGSMPPR